MGKRKRTEKGKAKPVAWQHRFLWPERVIEELLAFLDFGVQRNMSPAEINEEAAQHLVQEFDSSDYMSNKVGNKLRTLWREYGPSDDVSGNRDKIYEEGSKSLSWVKEGQREIIARRTKAIMHQKHTDFITSPRKTRSGSQAFNKGNAPPSRLGSARASSSITPQDSKTTQTARLHPLRPQQLDHSGRVDEVGSCSPQLRQA